MPTTERPEHARGWLKLIREAIEARDAPPLVAPRLDPRGRAPRQPHLGVLDDPLWRAIQEQAEEGRR